MYTDSHEPQMNDHKHSTLPLTLYTDRIQALVLLYSKYMQDKHTYMYMHTHLLYIVDRICVNCPHRDGCRQINVRTLHPCHT